MKKEEYSKRVEGENHPEAQAAVRVDLLHLHLMKKEKGNKKSINIEKIGKDQEINDIDLILKIQDRSKLKAKRNHSNNQHSIKTTSKIDLEAFSKKMKKESLLLTPQFIRKNTKLSFNLTKKTEEEEWMNSGKMLRSSNPCANQEEEKDQNSVNVDMKKE